MLNRIGRLLGNIKLTTMIATLVISSIIVSIAAVTTATYLNLSASTRAGAMARLESDLRTAATVSGGKMPGAEVVWAEDGGIEGIKTWAMPRLFVNHDLVDSVQRLTGESVTIYGAEDATKPLTALTSTLATAEDQRLIGQILEPTDPAYADLSAGKSYFGETTVAGTAYYTAYQPIQDQDGALIGALYVGTDKARLEAGILSTLWVLAGVGAVSLAILGIVGYVLSRVMMAAVPKLARTMKAVAEGDY